MCTLLKIHYCNDTQYFCSLYIYLKYGDDSFDDIFQIVTTYTGWKFLIFDRIKYEDFLFKATSLIHVFVISIRV